MSHIREIVRRWVRRHPLLYFSLVGHRKAVRRLRAKKNTQLVLEGFPRSANTTSVYALLYANQQSIKIAHHLHAPAHVVYAVRNKIPCLVIFRHPIDCVASLMVMHKGGDPVQLLKDYIDFAKITIKNQKFMVVADFREVVLNGIGPSIDRLNKLFEKSFRLPTNSEEEIKWVREQVKQWNLKHSLGDPEKLSIPNESKKQKSVEMKNRIKKLAFKELTFAEQLFEKILKSTN